jgi:D-arabinose 1-dehydrogenase-like Zn-dependent alcohol dehydrogenase
VLKTTGGFASHCRVNADWAFPIPDSLPAIGAAPLLCAGITTWYYMMSYPITYT